MRVRRTAGHSHGISDKRTGRFCWLPPVLPSASRYLAKPRPGLEDVGSRSLGFTLKISLFWPLRFPVRPEQFPVPQRREIAGLAL